jgi:hypothetical protein
MKTTRRVKIRAKRNKIIPEELPSLGYRINRVLIPGTTGGLYTIFSGAMLIFMTAGVYLFGFMFNKPIPNQFNDLLYSAVGLLTIHAGRSIFGGKNVAEMTRDSIKGVRTGEQIEIDTPDGNIRAEKSGHNPYSRSDEDIPPTMSDDDYVTLGNNIKG